MKISAGDMMRFCQLRLDEIPLRIFTGDENEILKDCKELAFH